MHILREYMHKITNRHLSFNRKGVGEVVLCYKRFFGKARNAAVTIDGWPDTTYFIGDIKDEEFKMLGACKSNVDLSIAIESLITQRVMTSNPVEWRFYASK